MNDALTLDYLQTRTGTTAICTAAGVDCAMW